MPLLSLTGTNLLLRLSWRVRPLNIESSLELSETGGTLIVAPQVLDYSFPGAFGDIVRVLKPILDIWGVLFSIVGPSECYGMKGYTSRWMLRVIALPLIGFGFVALAYAYDYRSGAAAARANLSTRMFFVLFLVCE